MNSKGGRSINGTEHFAIVIVEGISVTLLISKIRYCFFFLQNMEFHF